MKNKDIAYLGMLIALAFIFSYIETLIPFNFGVPGIKLGLANIVVIVALYTMGKKRAFFLSIVRILLVGITFGNISTMLYSLGGGIASYLVMVIAKKTGVLSMKGVSILGGVFHNVGQIIVAMIILETKQLIYYLPTLMIAGTVTGFFVGLLGTMVTERIKKGLKY